MGETKTLAKRSTELRGFLMERADRIKDALPATMKNPQFVQRLIKLAVQAYYSTPKLQACTFDSIYKAVNDSAQLGLDPCGLLGSAYIVPFKDQAQLIVGYRGLIDLARRSGQILSIEAHVVHANEKFRCIYGLNAVLEHEPAWDGEPGPVKAAYAIARLDGGATQWDVMTKKEIDAIRARSRAGTSGPWVTDYEEMAKKTVVRRICKYLPLTTELVDALEKMDSLEMGDAPPVIDTDIENVQPGKGTAAKVKDALKADAPAFDRKDATAKIAAWVKDAIDLSGFDELLEQVGRTRENYVEAGDGILEKLLAFVTEQGKD